MRIVFIGSVEFSHRALERLIALGGNVVGVCTLENSPFNADFRNLSSLASAHCIPWRYANDINSAESLEWISGAKPDVIFCFGWSRLLKKEILSIPPMGVVGFHPSALPANRGRHPLIWAIALGLKSTASTFFFMDDGADSGDILSQSPILISDTDDARSLYDKVVSVALVQIEQFLPQLICGNYPRIKQDESKANSWRKRGAVDGLIDWRMSATSIHNTVRALARPYVGAEFIGNHVCYKLWKSELIVCELSNIEPGKVVGLAEGRMPVVKCGVNALKLVEVAPDFRASVGMYL